MLYQIKICTLLWCSFVCSQDDNSYGTSRHVCCMRGHKYARCSYSEMVLKVDDLTIYSHRFTRKHAVIKQAIGLSIGCWECFVSLLTSWSCIWLFLLLILSQIHHNGHFYAENKYNGIFRIRIIINTHITFIFVIFLFFRSKTKNHTAESVYIKKVKRDRKVYFVTITQSYTKLVYVALIRDRGQPGE